MDPDQSVWAIVYIVYRICLYNQGSYKVQRKDTWNSTENLTGCANRAMDEYWAQERGNDHIELTASGPRVYHGIRPTHYNQFSV